MATNEWQPEVGRRTTGATHGGHRRIRQSEASDSYDWNEVLIMGVDIISLSSSLPAEQRRAVQAEYRRQAKDSTTAFLLCFFLGIFGAHCFYLGRMGQGIFRLVISPLIVPGLLWEIVDLTRIDGEVHARNLKLAEQLMASAMLSTPNSALLEAALGQLDVTPFPPSPVPALQLASTPLADIPAAASERQAYGPADEAPVASVSVSPLNSVHEPVPPDDIREQTLPNVAASNIRADDTRANPADVAPTYEWAPQWPIDAEATPAADPTASTDAAPSLPDALASSVRFSTPSDTEAPFPSWGGATQAPQDASTSASPLEDADSAARMKATAPGSATEAWDTGASAEDGARIADPGTAALAFGWLGTSEAFSAPSESPQPTANAWASPVGAADLPSSFATKEAQHAPGVDPTDRSLPAGAAGGTADIGELASADRVTVDVAAEGLDVAQEAQDASAWTTAPDFLPGDGNGSELLAPDDAGNSESQTSVVVLVADEGSEFDQRLAADHSAVASLATPDAAAADAIAPAEYQALVTDVPSGEQAASGAEPPRTVKRVRVVRKLLVNGQVVRETSAEQVIDGNADSQEAAVSLQRTLGTADPETLRALAADMDLTLPANSPLPASPSQPTDSLGTGPQTNQPTND